MDKVGWALAPLDRVPGIGSKYADTYRRPRAPLSQDALVDCFVGAHASR